MKTKYYFTNKFDTKIIGKLDKQTIVIYRNYKSNSNDILNIQKLAKYCRKIKLKFYLSNNIKLAIKLGLDGAYIPSFNRSFDHLGYSLKKKFKIIGSAHNIFEIKIKELQKVEKIFISSIFKKNQNYLGLYKFKILNNLTKKRVVALGGISSKNIKALNLVNNIEIAGISYFE